MQYKYHKKAGALQEAALPAPARLAVQSLSRADIGRQTALGDDFGEQVSDSESGMDMDMDTRERIRFAAAAPVTAQSIRHEARQQAQAASGGRRAGSDRESGLDATANYGRYSMFFYTIEEGQRVLVVRKSGAMAVVEGPQRFWRLGKTIRRMQHHVAHPGEFLIVRFRDGRQEHLRGPAHIWFDPREHLSVSKEEIFQIAEREAIVVYSKDEATGAVRRRITHGPVDFMTEPGEWLHTFSWHGSKPGPDGTYRKAPNALVFQKLWLLPDQMYHDVPEVRTADGAVLTIRLMLFFELLDIEKMLATTHDPIGDFVNAATSDVVEFLSKHDFESFKNNIEKLNESTTYKQLIVRAEQCGYGIAKVVYRGYGAPAALQQMHEQALESRTRLQLEKDTEKQAQDLEDLKFERRLARAAQERDERVTNQAQDLALAREREQAKLVAERELRALHREQDRLDATDTLERTRAEHQARLEWLRELSGLEVNLTEYLTQGRSDQVIELRGGNEQPAHIRPHIHLGVPGEAPADQR